MAFEVGITERGDAGLDFSWYDKLKDCNLTILITKGITDEFISLLLKAHSEGHKIILHATCTGFGGFPIEKNVQTKEWTHAQVLKLISLGFPVEQIVLRVDPIIPTDRGLQTAYQVLRLFDDTGIKRVRYSFLDMYAHVVERFHAKNITPPYTTFQAPKQMINNAIAMLNHEKNPNYEFEACAEYTPHRTGCVSNKDINLFGITGNLIGSANQRKTCCCVSNKKELLTKKNRCKNQCLYCFWKD